MRTLLYVLFLLQAMAGHSQRVVDVGKEDVSLTSNMFYAVGGEPVSTIKYVRVVAGSPYFNESWMRGKVVMSGGFVYDSVLLRLDLLDNSLQYIGRGGRELIAVSVVKAVILRDSVSGKG